MAPIEVSDACNAFAAVLTNIARHVGRHHDALAGVDNVEAAMTRGWIVAAVAVAASAGCGTTKTVTVSKTVTAEPSAKTGVGPPAELVEFGYIRSLRRAGTSYRMRFDPAWFLSGVTANVAAAEDGAVPRGQPVPNDNYVVNESHRPFTYVVPPSARVTVLKTGVAGTRITVAQLGQLVAGKHPFPRPLFERLDTGFWIRVHIDTVRSLDQQYHP
jgi:hypothetical protein